MSSARTIVDVARHHAETTPDRPAYVFLPDGETESGRFDFARVDLRARAIAAVLTERGLVGERVLIAYPSGAAYVQAILGCLYAGAVAVPCDAPERAAGVERLTAVAKDADPALTLAAADGPLAGRTALLDVDGVPDEAAERWSAPALNPGTPAFLQYTSGSTRTPRGVVVSHANLLSNEKAIERACGHSRDSTFVGWLPLFHDMGLVANVLQPLFLGSRSVLMPPAAFLRHPIRWLRAISRYRAHTSGGPNFGYELCVERVRPEDRAGLDLSSWLVAYNGAEPVRAATMRRFTQVFAEHGFASTSHFPCYGLAEATLLVAATPKSEPPAVLTVDRPELRRGRVRPAAESAPGTELVSCGRVALDTRVRIVDPETARPVADGHVGEVWVGGPGVSGGYWRDPDGSAEVMRARLAGEGPYLRTGDLGCLLDGRLYLTGRRKDLLVVRGQNHYPHDLEWTAEQAHPALRPSCGAAFAVDDGDRERLVLCYELRGPAPDLTAVAEAVRREISRRHGLEPHELVFVERGGIPKTTSGKVRRQKCRQSYVDGRLPVTGTVTLTGGTGGSTTVALPSPAALAELEPPDRVPALAAALRDAVVARTGATGEGPPPLDEPLSALGADSLTLMELSHRVEARYGVTLGPAVLLGDTGVREVARRILSAAQGAAGRTEPARPAAGPEWLPLTGGQRALWFEQQLAPESAAYHLARAMRIEGRLDVGALVRAFDRLVHRHPALRTRFALRDGEPLCRADPEGRRLVVTDAPATGDAEQADHLTALADRPFDLLAGPPVRAVLLRHGAERHVLLLVVHHLLADFWSFVVVMRELTALYGEETTGVAAALPPPGAEHADLVRAERRLAGTPEEDRMIRFWRNSLGGAPAALELPADRPRPAHRTFDGATHTFRLPAALTGGLRDLARAERCTLFTVLLTGYQLLLHRYSAQRDLVVGTPLARRDRADLANLVGYLVNPLPIRSRLDDAEPFRALLHRTRRRVLDAVGHGEISFDRLIGELAPARLADRPPLVQSLFVMHREYGPADDGLRALALGVPGRLAFGDLSMGAVPIRRRWSQLDLTLSTAEVGDELAGVWEYRTGLFTEAAVTAMTGHFARLLETAVADPGRPAGDIDLLTPKERRHVRRAAAGPHRPRPAGASLHRLVAQVARDRPDAVAVIADNADGGTGLLSYGALQRAATRVAARLAGRGGAAADPVALLLERGAALPLGYLAVLNAGAAVLPLNPDDPDRRLAAVLADSGARTVLTQRSLLDRAGRLGVTALAVEDLLSAPGRTRDVHPEQAAYLLYTSGSTGTPKGVLVPQRGIVNRILWMQEEYRLMPGERVLHKTPVTFDVSLWELFWPLVAGGCLVIARPGGHRDPAYLHTLIARHRVSTAHFVPSMLAPFLAERSRGRALPSLRRVVCSGEVLPPELCRRFAALFDAELHNLYGPTEASVDVTAWHCAATESGTVPIGRPIANTTCVVLGERGRVLPSRLVGELHAGGAGLALGYLNRPGPTAANFVPDPEGTGDRLYRTGDLARCRPDGVLEYRGRRDDQVKIAGNRVEPGEVAEALRRQPEVADAAVVARDQRLHGYVVADRPVSAEALRARLRELLPAFMVPAGIVLLDRLPLTGSGKLDTRALPVPPAERGGDVEPPRGDTEHRLAAIWREHLGLPAVGVTDDYFTLGGDSIRAIRVVTAARDAGLELTVTDLLRHRTIRDLARHLDRGPGPRTGAAGTRDVVQPFALCPAAAGRAGIEDAYPVSTAQRALLFHQENTPSYEVYVTSLTVHGALDGERLAEAVAGVTRRHAYLRSFFDLTGYDEPMQLVRADVPTPLRIVDLRELPDDRRRAVFQRWLHTERKRRFDVGLGPLVRFTAHDAGEGFRLTVSSFGLDGWCVAIVLTELLQRYRAHGGGARGDGGAPHVGYADFVALERQAMASDEHRRFWTAELAGADRCALPRWPGFPRERTEAGRQRRRVVEVDPGVHAGLTELAASLGVGLKHVLLGVHLRVVRTLTGQADTVTGLECHGRPERRDGDRVVGVFNNIVPLRADLDGLPSWAALARAAHAAEVRLSPFRRYPLARLHREHGAGRLFDTLFVFTHFHLYQELAGLGVSDLQAPDQTYIPLTAHFNLDAWTGRLRLLLDFDPAELAEEQIELAAGCYSRALAACAADPHRRPAATSSPALTGHADGGPGHDRPETVSDLVHQVVRHLPDHLAVAEGDRQLSYAGLWDRSGALAAVLQAAKAGPESVVGLLAPRRLDTVVALLAILRAGAAYLPLDPGLPPRRLRRLLVESGASVLVLPPAVAEPEWAHGLTVVRADASAGTRPHRVAAHRDSLACVMPTSGSTGVPKLVGVPHRGLVNYLRWSVDHYGITAQTLAPVASSLAFDLTVTALISPLAGGGAVDLLPAEEPTALGDALVRGRHTLVKLTPAHLAAVAEQLAPYGGRSGLRTVVVGGEQLHASHVRALRAVAPDADVVNEYGPTETVVGCCAHDVTAIPGEGPIPIGRAIAGAGVRVVDDGAEAPPGVLGELYVSGFGVTRGYLGRPADTAAAFRPDPHTHGGRRYRTGDRARRLPGGDLMFAGRADRQVKIRGHRVELGEVEHVLAAHPAVRQAAAEAQPLPGGRLRLTVYWVAAGEQVATAAGLTAWLARRLPGHLVPDALVRLPDLPMTANGKVDRARLPDGATRLAVALDRIEDLSDAEVARLLEHARSAGGPPMTEGGPRG